jgi:hypothetical protein
MDASKITQLLQKQNTRFINRCQTTDSSTLTWKNNIQSAKYIRGVPTCDQQVNPNVPTQPACSTGNGICSYGGQGKQMTLMTGSTQQFPSVFAGATGSDAFQYSSEQILLQKAGKESCGVPGTSPAPTNSYVVLPECYCVNTNGPTQSNPAPAINNNTTNPYLPEFDTYYKFKNPQAQCYNQPDQNQKHFVKQCHSRFPNANNGVSVNCSTCGNTPQTCDGCVLQQ